MVKMRQVASAGIASALLLGTWLVAGVSPAGAFTTVDKPAAIMVWPLVQVDTGGLIGDPTDTLIQLSNTNTASLRQAHCYYINANSHCASGADNAGDVCQTASQCPSGAGQAPCEPGWTETDFDIFITLEQPLAWHASEGLQVPNLPLTQTGTCKNAPTRTCSSGSQCASGVCNLRQSNLGTGIPPTPEDPFIGSLTCIEFNPANGQPDNSALANNFKGEGTIETILSGVPPTVPAGVVTLQKYSAVGIQSTGAGNGDNVLQIGGDVGSEYQPCATTLILDHLFEDDPGVSDRTDLTLVPCGNNFLTQTPGVVTAQFLVFNEFEQRFSTSRTVDCFFHRRLSLIDTTVPARSIFNFAVAGTVAGQTRIRGVGNAPTGRGLIGEANTFFLTEGAGYGLSQVGTPDFAGLFGAPVQPDVITIP